MNRIPLMVWALYATSIIQVLATPVLAITLLCSSVPTLPCGYIMILLGKGLQAVFGLGTSHVCFRPV
ncbi:hypothetical protein LEP1GSC027_3318 [Leptospira interrogans str. 2002000624]|nr:hypothetical protein LEP1GSC027_3318 [Leptospira interrogans str. 2002000624]